MALAAFNGHVQDLAGNAVAVASVEVRRAVPGQPLAAIYADRGGTLPLSNPFALDPQDNGYFRFHAAGGAYNIRAFDGNGNERTWSYVAIGLGGETDIDLGVLDQAVADAQAWAEDARDAADAAFVSADVYSDTAAGLADTTEGDQFQVVEGDDIVRYRHDAGPVATEVARYPSAAVVRNLQNELDGTSEEQERLRYLQRLRTENTGLPKAAVVILVGQSLNVSRITDSDIVQAKSDVTARMPAGGPCVNQFEFFSINATHATNYSDVASVVEYEERGGQCPGSGILATLAGTSLARSYLCSCAVGARTIEVLSSSGPRANIYAVMNRLCDIAREEGYDPIVMIYSAHGEADASAETSTQTYYARGVAFYRMIQLAAAQAMGRPGYVAPVVLTYPGQQIAGDSDAAIKEAIRLIIKELPNAIDGGPVYQWPMLSDNVHPSPGGYVLRGEWIGTLLRDWWEQRARPMLPQIVDVTLSGGTFRAVFNMPVIRDDSLGTASNLPSTDGLQWFDNGSQITIDNLSYGGRVVDGTLASVPDGTTEQQELRIAVQQTSPGGQISGNVAGSYIRANDAGTPSIFDPAYIHYRWAVPQIATVRDA